MYFFQTSPSENSATEIQTEYHCDLENRGHPLGWLGCLVPASLPSAHEEWILGMLITYLMIS